MKKFIMLFSVYALILIISPELLYAKRPACSSAMVNAAVGGDYDIVKKELSKGVKPDCVTITNGLDDADIDMTPLMLASSSARYDEHIKTAEILLNGGADINAKHRYGGTALEMAALRGNTKMVEFLVKKGADVNANHGYTLSGAAFNGHADIVKILIDNGADINIQNKDGETPLFSATYSNRNKDIVFILLEKGADVNIKSKKSGRTALLNAADNADIGLIKVLLEKGADISAVDKEGKTVLITFIERMKNDQFEGLKLLVEKGADINAVVKLPSPGKTDTKKNNGVNSGTIKGFTPLMQAVKRSLSVEIIRFLISKGADVNTRDEDGNTALSLAGFKREIADILIQAGAKD